MQGKAQRSEPALTVGCVVDDACDAPPTQYRPGLIACDTVISYTPGVPPVATVPALPVPVEMVPASNSSVVGLPVVSSLFQIPSRSTLLASPATVNSKNRRLIVMLAFTIHGCTRTVPLPIVAAAPVAVGLLQ